MTIKVGGSFIKIDAAEGHLTFVGSAINLNTAVSAGSGSWDQMAFSTHGHWGATSPETMRDLEAIEGNDALIRIAG